MTLSPAFVDEMTLQLSSARQALDASLAGGDESDVAVARARLDELLDLWSRASDARLDP